MITYNNLFEKAFSFENLIKSYYKARLGHSRSYEVADFSYTLEENIFQLMVELNDGTYKTGSYRVFSVFEPKERIIKAVPFRDRVVHHAIHSVLEPIFEARFIEDSYACRKDKGTYHGLVRLKKHVMKPIHKQYALKCDVKKYFPSIDHEILKSIVRNKVKDKKFNKTLFEIIDSDSSMFGVDKGIPIGNLTSQLFANIYLHGLDMYVKHELKIKPYFRYVDDFIILSDSKDNLKQTRKQITSFLKNELKLTVPYYKANIFLVKDGVDFIGYKIFPTKILVRKSNYKRLIRRLKYLNKLYGTRTVSKEQFEDMVKVQYSSWTGYAKHADAYRLTKKTFTEFRSFLNL